MLVIGDTLAGGLPDPVMQVGQQLLIDISPLREEDLLYCS